MTVFDHSIWDFFYLFFFYWIQLNWIKTSCSFSLSLFFFLKLTRHTDYVNASQDKQYLKLIISSTPILFKPWEFLTHSWFATRPWRDSFSLLRVPPCWPLAPSASQWRDIFAALQPLSLNVWRASEYLVRSPWRAWSGSGRVCILCLCMQHTGGKGVFVHCRAKLPAGEI